jgi:hypothetical protein
VSCFYVHAQGFRGVTFVDKLVAVSGFHVHEHGDEPFRGVTSVLKLGTVSDFYLRAYGGQSFRDVTFVVKLGTVSDFYLRAHGGQSLRGVTSVVKLGTVSDFNLRAHGGQSFRGVTSVVKLGTVSDFNLRAHGGQSFRGVTSVVKSPCPTFAVRCVSCELHSIITGSQVWIGDHSNESSVLRSFTAYVTTGLATNFLTLSKLLFLYYPRTVLPLCLWSLCSCKTT